MGRLGQRGWRGPVSSAGKESEAFLGKDVLQDMPEV